METWEIVPGDVVAYPFGAPLLVTRVHESLSGLWVVCGHLYLLGEGHWSPRLTSWPGRSWVRLGEAERALYPAGVSA